MFVVTLAVAGNETTRNSITQGMMAFTDFPDQWELFKAQRRRPPPTRSSAGPRRSPRFSEPLWWTPSFGGVPIKKGQRLVLFYRSANFDEDVFDDPFAFDILRDPNPHLGFGGTGAHYCVGANLARMTIDLMFNAIADHIARAEPFRRPSGCGQHDHRHQALAGRIPMNCAAVRPAADGVQHHRSSAGSTIGPLVAWFFVRNRNKHR